LASGFTHTSIACLKMSAVEWKPSYNASECNNLKQRISTGNCGKIFETMLAALTKDFDSAFSVLL
jgi:hypothetical protein